jgi:hypothetical protein
LRDSRKQRDAREFKANRKMREAAQANSLTWQSPSNILDYWN